MVSDPFSLLDDPIFSLLPDGGLWVQFVGVVSAAFGVAVVVKLISSALGSSR